MILLAKIGKDGLLDLRCCHPNEGSKITELRNSGFLDFVAAEQPQCDTGNHVVESLQEIGGKIVQAWQIMPDE